jgi:hypothetical protein
VTEPVPGLFDGFLFAGSAIGIPGVIGSVEYRGTEATEDSERLR